MHEQALRDIGPLRAAIGRVFAKVTVSADGALDPKLSPEVFAHLDVDGEEVERVPLHLDVQQLNRGGGAV